jgi:hypothetical protein
MLQPSSHSPALPRLLNKDAARISPSLQSLHRHPAFTSINAARLLEQQMYFWGADVLFPSENLLASWGCRKFHQPTRPHAVHCYQLSSPLYSLILHSSGALFHHALHPSLAIAYLRPHHRLFSSPSLNPGILPASHKPPPPPLRSLRPSEIPPTLVALLQLVQDYESWAAPRLPHDHRHALYREFRKVPHAVRWLPPDQSSTWLLAFLQHHSTNSRFPPASISVT